jgi:hypothetical protein
MFSSIPPLGTISLDFQSVARSVARGLSEIVSMGAGWYLERFHQRSFLHCLVIRFPRWVNDEPTLPLLFNYAWNTQGIRTVAPTVLPLSMAVWAFTASFRAYS